jgi:succinoglycan biosynthesis protein ExoL
MNTEHSYIVKGPQLAPVSLMTHVAFFAQDAADAAVRRRVQGFRDDGLRVTGFTMRRRDQVNVDWDNVDLGRTYDAAYLQRIRSISRGARLAAGRRDILAQADIIYARNLDMLATAFHARRIAGLDTPVIYEALDVHRLLTRKDVLGLAFRRLEGALLARTRALVVSSPGFLRNHFGLHHHGRYVPFVLENRLAAGADYGPRPSRRHLRTGPLQLGWIGMLRCRRTLDLLLKVAREAGPSVHIHLHGVPALTEIPDFHARIKSVANLTFHGRYRSPEDLARVYAGLDVVWAGDFMEAGFNSAWLLPNRIYEGGYFGVPAIAPAGTQTASWIEARGVGFTLPENLATTLHGLILALAANGSPVAVRRKRLLDLPASTFVAPRGELASLINQALGRPGASGIADMPRISTSQAAG